MLGLELEGGAHSAVGMYLVFGLGHGGRVNKKQFYIYIVSNI